MNNKIGKDHPSSWNPNADKLTIHGWIRYHYKKSIYVLYVVKLVKLIGHLIPMNIQEILMNIRKGVVHVI